MFANIDNGTYASVYKVGDTIPLDLGSEGLINMQIAGIDVDDLADGSGKAHISWISKELLATSHRMNPARVTNDDGTYQEGTGTIGGWGKCEMRTYLNDTIYPLIPEDVQAMIKTVTKTHQMIDTAGSALQQTTYDDLWIPSWYEITASSSVYGKLINSDDTRKKCIVNTSTYAVWATRYATETYAWYCVDEWGALGWGSWREYYNFGIALGFCT